MWQLFWSEIAEAWRLRGRRYALEGAVLAVLVVFLIPTCSISTAERNDGLTQSTDSLLADLAALEAETYEGRAALCSKWAARRVPWDEAGEEATMLRTGPYPWDTPREPTWSAQAEVWSRAAEKSRATSDDFRRRSWGWKQGKRT
ncbi:MAG TPA: hypothetical protein VG406_18470 [Isosphaeraceae bacterium]|nr:hypothetical protein [Isosphaeraceae bacterium]